MPNLPGPMELIIVLGIVLIVFGGGSKLPKLARSLREAKSEFDKPSKDDGTKDTVKELPKSDDDDKVTLSKAELDALLAERELKAKRD